MRPQIAVGETPHGQAKHGQQREQRHRASVAEAQPGDVRLSPTVTGSVTLCSARAAAIGSWPSRWVASSRRLAWKPTCRSAGRFLSRLPIAEVPGVVDRGFGSDRSLELVVLLDLGVLVVNVDRGGDLGAEHAGAPPRRGRAPAAQAHAAVKDQAGLVGPAEVEVLADQLLKEHAARVGAVQHLGERELGLQDRQLIAVAGPAVGRGERVRQPRQPAAKERVDLRRRQPLADPLQRVRVIALPESRCPAR